MIVVNEYEYALMRLKNKDIGDDIRTTLNILAKYYRSQGLKKHAICVELQNFLEIAYPKYILGKRYWIETIEKTVTKTANEKLFESDGVWVTESEWEKIQSLENKSLRKLAFALLCIAKINNQKREYNNNWVNTSLEDIFKSANLSGNMDSKLDKLGDLIRSGFTEFAKRIDNLNLKVLFIDEESEKKYLVSDFRNIGNEYLYLTGENYIRCAECGKVIKNNKYGNKKYCSECAAYNPQETKQVTCVDCGKTFIVDARISNKCRCDECQAVVNREKKRIWKRNHDKK